MDTGAWGKPSVVIAIALVGLVALTLIGLVVVALVGVAKGRPILFRLGWRLFGKNRASAEIVVGGPELEGVEDSLERTLARLDGTRASEGEHPAREVAGLQPHGADE